MSDDKKSINTIAAESFGRRAQTAIDAGEWSLKLIVERLEAMDTLERSAAVKYLADRYLDLRLWKK